MRFKTNKFGLASSGELDNNENTAPSEERSTLLNDPTNPFHSFLENIRALVESSVDEQGQEYVVALGVDQETGYLSMSITKHSARQTQNNPKDYKKIIQTAIESLEKDQIDLLQHHSKIVDKIQREKAIYEQWKRRVSSNSMLGMMKQGWMQLIETPRVGKERSDSKDTAETMEYYELIPNEEPEISQQSELNVSELMEVE